LEALHPSKAAANGFEAFPNAAEGNNRAKSVPAAFLGCGNK
jgi:hypothetical protein